MDVLHVFSDEGFPYYGRGSAICWAHAILTCCWYLFLILLSPRSLGQSSPDFDVMSDSDPNLEKFSDGKNICRQKHQNMGPISTTWQLDREYNPRNDTRCRRTETILSLSCACVLNLVNFGGKTYKIHLSRSTIYMCFHSREMSRGH